MYLLRVTIYTLYGGDMAGKKSTFIPHCLALCSMGLEQEVMNIINFIICTLVVTDHAGFEATNPPLKQGHSSY